MAVQVGLLLSSRIPWSSDQAVVGLMARHILEGRGHPVFYYGATYAGSLEAHGVAAVFGVFGATRAVYAGAMVFLALGIVAGTGLVARRAFGTRSALIALSALAVPPFFFLYKSLTSDGAYDSVALVAIGHLLAALAVEERAAAGRSARWAVALLGLAAGVGFWITPVCLPLTAAAFFWIAFRRLAGPGSILPLAAGAALGAAPWLVWNARHGWASLRAPEAARVDLAGFLSNAWSFLTVSLPILVGAARPNHEPGSPEESFRGASILAPLALGLLLAPAVRRFRRDPRVALLCLTLGAVAGAALLSQRFTPAEPRYFMAVYVVVPPLLGAAAEWWGATRRRLRLAAFAVAVLLATHVGGYARAYVHGPVANDAQVTGPLEDLLASLNRLGVRRVWASYWTSYRLAFETGEAVIASPLGAEDVVRMPAYAAAVREAPDAAVVLLPPRTACFSRWLDEGGVRAVRTRAGAFTIFSSLPPAVHAAIAAGDSLPLPEGAERASWRLLSPPVADGGGGVIVEAEVRNEGPCLFTHAVSIVTSSSAPGGPWSMDAETHLPNVRLAPGESARVRVTIARTDPARSRFRLRLAHRATGAFPDEGSALVIGPGGAILSREMPGGIGREGERAGSRAAAAGPGR